MPYYPPSTTLYNWTPVDRGYLGESFPAQYVNGTQTLATAGRVEFVKIKLPQPTSVTNVIFWVSTAGNTLTVNQCLAALYTEAGSRVGVTADQSVAWVSSGIKTMALASGPFTCAAGNYYVAFFYNGTTGPTLGKFTHAGTVALNAGLGAAALLTGNADTGQTTTIPSTLGAQTSSTNYYWAAVS